MPEEGQYPALGSAARQACRAEGTREVSVQSVWHLVWASGPCLDKGIAIPLGTLTTRTSETQLQPGNRLSFWVI